MPFRHALVRLLASASLAAAVLAPLPSTADARTTADVRTTGDVRTTSDARTTRDARTTSDARTTRDARTAAVAVEPVPPVRQPAPASADVPMEPSAATVAVETDKGRVGPEAPEVTTPAGPALVERIEAEASKRAGGPGPDLRAVLPDTAQAAPLKLSTPVAGLFNAIRLPVGALTYRLCVQSAEVPVSCSGGQPLVKPVAADVTGDGVADLAARLLPTAQQQKFTGLDFTVKRLPGRPELQARVWAEYDERVSIGFDGMRDGSALSASDRGTFTVDPTGKRVKADVERTDPGASAAVVAGLTGRTLVRLRQTPATDKLTIDATLDATRLDLTASIPGPAGRAGGDRRPADPGGAGPDAHPGAGDDEPRQGRRHRGPTDRRRLHRPGRAARPDLRRRAAVQAGERDAGGRAARLHRQVRRHRREADAGPGHPAAPGGHGPGRLLRQGGGQDRAAGGAERPARPAAPDERPGGAPGAALDQLADRQVRAGGAARRGRDLHPAGRPRHDDQERAGRRRLGAAVRAVRLRRHLRRQAPRPPDRHRRRPLLRRRRQSSTAPTWPGWRSPTPPPGST